MGDQTFQANGANSGYVGSENSNVTTARNGSNLFLSTNSHTYCGFFDEGGNYRISQLFLEFDTSSFIGVPASAKLRIYTPNWDVYSADDGQVLQARLFDYGTLATADYRTPGNFNSCPLLATYPMDDISPPQWMEFVDVDLLDNINFSGMTRIILCTDLFSSSGTPTEQNHVYIGNFTTNLPELVVSTAGGHRMFLTF